MKKIIYCMSILLLCALFIGLPAGCGMIQKDNFQSAEDFAEAKMGVLTGSSHDATTKNLFPNAERVYFSSLVDMILSVEQGKIDCYLEDAPFLAGALWEGSNIKRIDEPVAQVENGVLFQKLESNPLQEEFNAFLAEVKADGTIDRLVEKWTGDKEPTEHPDYSVLTGENGTIHLALVLDNKPLIYLHNNRYTGFEIELLTLFGEKYGYDYNFEAVPFGSVVAGIAVGKYDMAVSGLTITEERKQSANFSDPYATFDVVLVTKGDAEEGDDANQKIQSLEDIENGTIAILTGCAWDDVAKKDFPSARRMYFSSNPDMIVSLTQGKVDTIFADRTVYANMRWENDSLTVLDETIGTLSNALILAKENYDEDLLAQINAFVAQCREDGTLDKLAAKWFADAEPTEHPDYRTLSGENGTLKIAVDDTMKPLSYRRNDTFTGYEIDFLTLFAQEYGYRLDIKGMTFGALIPTVSTGKCDIGASGITITPERMDSVTFADSHLETEGVAVVYNGQPSAEKKTDKTLDDFAHASIGIMTGSVYDDYAKELFPDAERHYFSLMPDLILAVEQGKTDGFISEKAYVAAARWEGANICTIDEVIDQTNAGYILPKDDSSAVLREQLNAFIGKLRDTGAIEKLEEKWFGDIEPTEPLDYDSLTGENGTLRVAVAPDLKPICYVKNDQVTGYELEILVDFAREHGYQLDISIMTFDAILPGITSGKFDIGLGGITITEERAESVAFSESHLTAKVVMTVKDESAQAEGDFFAGLKESFDKTFIREDRWKLIVQGIGVTMLISTCSVVAGTLLGFGLYMLSRSNRKGLQKTARGIAQVYTRIIAGTPVVVILMILFYVVFGGFRDISGILVAIIGFTLTFGSFVYSHMTVSVSSVDYGQTEAAYALGYTRNKAFFRIVFPQAMSVFLPSYCGQAVELIKATAVVGYIAVNDLTKMGDIIRSNTYEAFFPLMATAVIYFMLTWIAALLLGNLKRKFEPKRRSREDILKGVKNV